VCKLNKGENTNEQAFSIKKQAFAQAIPFILEAAFPSLSILHLDKGKLVLIDSQQSEKRIKVICSSTKSYDVFPSFTKGHKRDKNGVNPMKELKQLCDQVMFVDMSSSEELHIKGRCWFLLG
jgi:hypothetical protein